MANESSPSLPASSRVFLSLLIPITGAFLLNLIANLLKGGSRGDTVGAGAPILGLVGLGLASLFLGQFWYGLNGLGLSGGRPLYAGIGFAVLGWVLFLVTRLSTVIGTEEGPKIDFLYLLLFEAFCVQLWTFGLFFRTVADWRGPLTASVSSGILFGAIAVQFFHEFSIIIFSGAFFAAVWGMLYGIIRLRTGGILGIVIVQALQSWSAWQLFKASQPDLTQLRVLYLISSILFAIVIWRLWPKKATDYRI